MELIIFFLLLIDAAVFLLGRNKLNPRFDRYISRKSCAWLSSILEVVP